MLHSIFIQLIDIFCMAILKKKNKTRNNNSNLHILYPLGLPLNIWNIGQVKNKNIF